MAGGAVATDRSAATSRRRRTPIRRQRHGVVPIEYSTGTTITDDISGRVPFGDYASWSDVTRYGQHIQVVTAWAQLVLHRPAASFVTPKTRRRRSRRITEETVSVP